MTGEAPLLLAHLLLPVFEFHGDDLSDLLGSEVLVELVFTDGLSDSPRVSGPRADAAVWQGSGESEVTYFDLAILVDQYVRRLDVSVDNVRRVQVLEGTEQVVQDQLHVLLSKLAG